MAQFLVDELLAEKYKIVAISRAVSLSHQQGLMEGTRMV